MRELWNSAVGGSMPAGPPRDLRWRDCRAKRPKISPDRVECSNSTVPLRFLRRRKTLPPALRHLNFLSLLAPGGGAVLCFSKWAQATSVMEIQIGKANAALDKPSPAKAVI